MWKNFKESLAAWIPEHISTKVIVWLYLIFDFFCVVSKKRRKNNYSHNLNHLNSDDSPLHQSYIENQNQWGNIHFGKTTMAFAGCEVMAVYNALLALGQEAGPVLISKLIDEFERKGAAFQGWIGTSPLAIRNYLNRCGIKNRLVWKAEELNDVGVAIITVYNDKSTLYSQIHTIALTKEENEYIAHNAIKKHTGYSTLKDAVNNVSSNPKLICAIEILQ